MIVIFLEHAGELCITSLSMIVYGGNKETSKTTENKQLTQWKTIRCDKTYH
jgi:hypothetical protein